MGNNPVEDIMKKYNTLCVFGTWLLLAACSGEGDMGGAPLDLEATQESNQSVSRSAGNAGVGATNGNNALSGDLQARNSAVASVIGTTWPHG